VAERDRLQPGEPVAAAGTAEEDRQVVADQFAATAGQDRRPVAEACPLLLASIGREPSDTTALRVDVTPDRVAARPCRVDELANRAFQREHRRKREECRRNRSKEGQFRLLAGSGGAKPPCSVAPPSSEPAAACILGGQVVRYRPGGSSY